MYKKMIAQGAESKIFAKGKSKIIKNRFKKTYRIKEIDDKLRAFRTRREAKVLRKLRNIGFLSPELIESDERENLVIEKIDGKLLKEAFDKNYVKFSEEIGEQIAIMHNNSIIHGDLTTSNMILNKKADKVYFIDFGLSFFSDKFEDKAVDLHLLKEALESKHYKVWQAAFKIVLNSYEKEAKDSKTILNRLKAVEKRGRYRAKKGS